nr:MAG TPA: hypothetical protein [Caudoviricetes sp.]
MNDINRSLWAVILIFAREGVKLLPNLFAVVMALNYQVLLFVEQ